MPADIYSQPTAAFAAVPDDPCPSRHVTPDRAWAEIRAEAEVPDPAVMADVRREAIDRMASMNLEHAKLAWQLRRKDPIEPYGLALLYAQPEDRAWRGHRYRVTAATRLWLAGTGTRDLADHLFRYYTGITDRLAAPGYDVRAEADRRDDAMTDDAEYVGLAVSSLDTETGPWRDARAGITDDSDVVPGRIWILLTDSTTIRCERRGRGEFNARQIFTTGSLDYTPGNPPYLYRPTEIADMYVDPGHRAVLRWMGALNTAFWQVDNLRVTAIHAGRRP